MLDLRSGSVLINQLADFISLVYCRCPFFLKCIFAIGSINGLLIKLNLTFRRGLCMSTTFKRSHGHPLPSTIGQLRLQTFHISRECRQLLAGERREFPRRMPGQSWLVANIYHGRCHKEERYCFCFRNSSLSLRQVPVQSSQRSTYSRWHDVHCTKRI